MLADLARVEGHHETGLTLANERHVLVQLPVGHGLVEDHVAHPRQVHETRLADLPPKVVAVHLDAEVLNNGAVFAHYFVAKALGANVTDDGRCN